MLALLVTVAMVLSLGTPAMAAEDGEQTKICEEGCTLAGTEHDTCVVEQPASQCAQMECYADGQHRRLHRRIRLHHHHAEEGYLKTLNNGEHTLTVVFKDGEANTTFHIRGGVAAPDTGDNSQLGLWSGMVTFSLMAMMAALLFDRKRKGAQKT